MRKSIGRSLAALALVGALALPACSPPKYALYTSLKRDFQVNVPWAWNVVTDEQGNGFTSVNFIGPFEPLFYLGVPSFSIRWHKRYYPHKLPTGLLEMYSDTDDFITQTLDTVYGPKYAMLQPVHEISVAGRAAKHFVVLSAAPAAAGAQWGVMLDEGGRTINPRKHAYVIVPMPTGFYVLVYPATRDGFKKYEAQFNQLVNSFWPLKEGPDGPALPPPPKPKK